MKDTYNLEDIISSPWFIDRINDNGSEQDFREWWDTTVYHKIPDHTFERAEKILTRYERFSSKNADFKRLEEITKGIEFPEMYSSSEDRYYVFLPDACGEEEYRLSVFTGEGTIVNHKAFPTREDSLVYAAKKGCDEVRTGSMDRLTETIAHQRSLVTYEAVKANIDIDTYLRRTKNMEHIRLFSERVKVLKKFDREKRNKEILMTP